MDDLRQEIRAQITRYLTRSIDVRRLYDWLVSSTWEVERRASEPTAELARSAHLLLEEFRAEGWPEDELRSHLRGLIAVVGEPAIFDVSSGSGSTTAIHTVPITMQRPGFITEWKLAGRSL